MPEQKTTDLAAVIAAARKQALEEAARVARAEIVVGNNLLDSEQGANTAAERIAVRLQELARMADA